MKSLLIFAALFLAAFARDPLCPAPNKCEKLPPGVMVKCSTSPPRVLGVTANKCYDIFASECVACHGTNNQIVKTYELTQCPRWIKAPNCEKEGGNTPACAYTSNNKLKSYKNYCYACTDGNDFYIEGKCPKLKGYCNQGGGLDGL
jgi:hypothetical protein